MNLLGLLASVLILAAYWVSVVKEDPLLFHGANAILWPPVVIPSVVHEVWGAALLTTSFGLLGTWALIKEFRPKPRRPKQPSKPCSWPIEQCTCSNGIGCVNVPMEEW